MPDTKPFQIFSSSLLDRFTAEWKYDAFTLRSSGRPVMMLLPDDARELADALQRFLAGSEG